jgi:hypothetical protein
MQNIQENVQTTTHRQRCSFSGSVNTCERREQPVNNRLRHLKSLNDYAFYGYPSLNTVS